jgi:hypothetical protein
VTKNALNAFKLNQQQKRNFAAGAGEVLSPYPLHLSRQANFKKFIFIAAPFYLAWSYVNILNPSHDIFYPPEALLLEQERKDGLRDAHYTPIGRSLDQY